MLRVVAPTDSPPTALLSSFVAAPSAFRNTSRREGTKNSHLLNSSDGSPGKQLSVHQFHLSDDGMNRLVSHISQESEAGLLSHQDSTQTSSLKMLDTCIPDDVTGKESGRYVTLDVGGSRVRASLCELDDGAVNVVNETVKEVPKWCKDSSTTAGAFLKFLSKEVEGCSQGSEPIGFTFSFPMKQHARDSATLLSLCKGWHTATATTDPLVGTDVVAGLNRALEAGGSKKRAVVSVNDTVGTQQYLTYKLRAQNAPGADMGIILGTGFNICYTEPKAADYGMTGDIVNTEMGALRVPSWLRTSVDNSVDQDNDPGVHQFEKMISGKYVGAMTSRAFHEAQNRPKPLPRELTGDEASRLAQAHAKGTEHCTAREVLGQDLTSADARSLCETAYKVFARSAQLLACCVKSSSQRLNKGEVVAAIDGSMYRENPFYQQLLQRELSRIMGNTQVAIHLSDDGSGRGAATMAAAAAPNGTS